MPLYEFENTVTGTRMELVLPVAERDRVDPPWKRVAVPRRIGFMSGRVDPASADGTVPKAFKDLEQTVPASTIARQSGFTVDQIKKIWSM